MDEQSMHALFFRFVSFVIELISDATEGERHRLILKKTERKIYTLSPKKSLIRDRQRETGQPRIRIRPNCGVGCNALHAARNEQNAPDLGRNERNAPDLGPLEGRNARELGCSKKRPRVLGVGHHLARSGALLSPFGLGGGVLPPLAVRARRRLSPVPESRPRAMSRGTRVGGDVMGLMPDDDDDPYEEPFPYTFALPEGSPHGIGRVGILNDQLICRYNQIRDLGNEMYANERTSFKCHPLAIGKLYSSVQGRFIATSERLRSQRDRTCRIAMSLIGELEALGHDTYIPYRLEDLVHRPNWVPPGSMGYLSRRPHYFCPEEYAIPFELPSGDDTIADTKRICNIGDANSFLRTTYSAIAKSLNRIHFFRNCCVRQRALAGDGNVLPQDDLTEHVKYCRRELEAAADLIRIWQGAHNALFNMPDGLHDLLMYDPAIVTQESLGKVSCIFPGGIHPFGDVEMYILYESALGYAVFRVHSCGILEQTMGGEYAADLDWETFSRAVRLVVYYPFHSETDAIRQLNNISLGIMTPVLKSILELYLPDQKGWKKFCLGVLDPILANYIHEDSGIACRCNNFVRGLLRAIRLHFCRCVEIETLDMENAQIRMGNSYSDERLLEEMLDENDEMLDEN